MEPQLAYAGSKQVMTFRQNIIVDGTNLPADVMKPGVAAMYLI
jgi:hypothetical protein